MDLLSQKGRWAHLRLQNAKSTGIAYGGDEFRAREIGAHRRNHNRSLNTKSFAKACS